MIHGIGVDISHIPRFISILSRDARYTNRFVAKMLHPNEIERFHSIKQSNNHSIQQAIFLASRWAVKEAAVKASGVRLIFPDMEITRSLKPSHNESIDQPDNQSNNQSNNQSIKVSLKDYDPRPKLVLSGESLSMCEQLKIDTQSINLSLSHDGDYAIAYIIMTKTYNQTIKR